MHSVYILQSLKDSNYYVGVTKNLPRRVNEHNSGNSKSTKGKRPFKLVYLEEFTDAKSAYRRERWIKAKKSKRSIERIIKNAACSPDLAYGESGSRFSAKLKDRDSVAEQLPLKQ